MGIPGYIGRGIDGMCVFLGITLEREITAAMRGTIHDEHFITLSIQTISLTKHPLMMNRHRHIGLGRQRILLLPQARHRLLLRIKVQPNLAIKRIRTPSRNTLLVPREREVRHPDRHRDRDVDPDLAALDMLLEGLRGRAGLGEDGDAVAVLVGVDEVDGVGEGLDLEGDEDGAEDLLFVALHVWLDAGDDRGADPVACFILDVCI